MDKRQQHQTADKDMMGVLGDKLHGADVFFV
jgi:hypothetical protein